MSTIVVFGAVPRVSWKRTPLIHSLSQLLEETDTLVPDGDGVTQAIQALLLGHRVILLRVLEEGVDLEGYCGGLRWVSQTAPNLPMHAMSLPGVGDPEVLGRARDICQRHRMVLMMSAQDLYDCVTA